MQRKALLLDSNDVLGEIYVLPSREAISSFLEFESYSGDELAFLEDGERLNLIVRCGREFKDLFGLKKSLTDFKYIESVETGDFTQLDILKGAIVKFLARRAVDVSADHTIESLVAILIGEIGIRG